MREFHHVGVITDDPQPDEIYVPETKVYVTNPNEHPYKIEYLRFEADTPVTGPVRNQPHIAFKVPDIDQEIAGLEVLLGPFQAMDNLKVVFVLIDGAVYEFMEFTEGSEFGEFEK
ncbi:VOC family protein [Gimesia sp.]|uniref:VOC family protein n=1 Tax=Gimesia sp. TaxID=2024833 RepID=UPI003A9011C4